MSDLSLSALLTELALFAEPALLHEALGRRGALSHDIKPVFAGAKVMGTAFTVRGTAGDNLAFHRAIAEACPGNVLVATVNGFLEAGGFGEIAAVAAKARGLLGFVLDGSVRDVDCLSRVNFPVFARGVSIKGTMKCFPGEMNVPIDLAGVRVNPGDIVVGGSDGVVIVPRDELSNVITRARAIKHREAEMIARIKSGELTLDLLNLRSQLANKAAAHAAPDATVADVHCR